MGDWCDTDRAGSTRIIWKLNLKLSWFERSLWSFSAINNFQDHQGSWWWSSQWLYQSWWLPVSINATIGLLCSGIMEKLNKESIINVITKVIILRLIIVIIVEIRKIVIVIVLAIHVNVNVKFKFINIVALETLFLRGSVIPQPSPSPSPPSPSSPSPSPSSSSSFSLPSLPVTSCQYYHRLPLLGFFRPVHANADSADTENTSGIEVDNHDDESIWKLF